MIKGLIIRDARLNETGKISRLIKEAYSQYKTSYPPDVWEYYLNDITDVSSRSGLGQLIVAEMEQNLVGTVTLFLKPSVVSGEGWPKGWAGIRLLAVHPRYRNRGIGRALMDECVRRCREHNIVAIGLHTNIAMEVARRMYEKMGFKRASKFDFYPVPEVFVMAYSLDLKRKESRLQSKIKDKL